MKFFFIIFSFILNIKAHANENWTYVTTSESGIFFIDKNSIHKSGDSITYWHRRNFAKRDAYGDLSVKVQSTINCRTREAIDRYYMLYDDINNNGKLTLSFEPKSSWIPISPDAAIWFFFVFVCK